MNRIFPQHTGKEEKNRAESDRKTTEGRLMYCGRCENGPSHRGSPLFGGCGVAIPHQRAYQPMLFFAVFVDTGTSARE